MLPDEELLCQIYDTCLNPILWPQVLDAMSSRFGGAAAVLYDRTTGDGSLIGINAIQGYSAGAIDAFQRHYRFLDVRTSHAVTSPTINQTYFDDRDIAFNDIEKTELHNDFYKPHGVGHIGAVVLTKSPSRFSVLSIHRASQHGGFSKEEVALFESLATHLARAWRIGREMRRSAGVADAIVLALARFHTPVFLVDARGSLLRMSAPAEELLRQGDPLRLRHGRLETARHSEIDMFRRAIAAAANPIVLGGNTRETTMKLAGQTAQDDLTLLFSACSVRNLSANDHVLIFADNPQCVPPADVDILTRQFQLTAAEARVVASLTSGLSVAAMAQQFRVSAETIRSQLKSAMGKCETQSQGQMVGLALRSLAALRRE
jgi:DNA-binding CsgD family transcriptional regulator